MRRFARLEDCGLDETFPLLDGLRRLGGRLEKTACSGCLGFVVCESGRRVGYVSDLDSGKVTRLDDEKAVREAGCSFIVWTSERVLRDVLRGIRSPLDALVAGRLRYAGKEDVGVEIFRSLATDTADILAPCHEMGGPEDACR